MSRGLSRALFAFVACLTVAGIATSLAEGNPPAYSVSALKLGMPDFPQFHISALQTGKEGKPQVGIEPIDVPEQSPGREVQIPKGSSIRLFQTTDGRMPEEGTAPFLEIPQPQGLKEGDKVFLVFHPDAEGKLSYRVVDASISKHPPGSVRFLNLGSKRMAFSVGSSPQPVLPGGEGMAVPVPGEKGRFGFTYFEERPGESPYQSPRANLRFRFPDQRLLVVFSPAREESSSGEMLPDGREKMLVSYRYRPVMVFDRCGTNAVAPAGEPAGGPEAPDAAPPRLPAADAGVNAKAEMIVLPGAGGIKVLGGKSPIEISKASIGEFIGIGSPDPSGLLIASSSPPDETIAKVPPGTLNGLAVIAEGEGARYRAAVFDDSRLSHPEGRLRVFNMTPYQLAYSKPDHGIDYIDPLAARVVEAGEFPLKLAAKAKAGWVLVSDQIEPPPLPGTRNYFFVSKKPGADEFAIFRKTR